MCSMKKIVGRNLKYYRYKTGLSQEKFYEQYNLNPKYLASIERGEINVTIDFREFFNPDKNRIITKKRIDEKEKEDL